MKPLVKPPVFHNLSDHLIDALDFGKLEPEQQIKILSFFKYYNARLTFEYYVMISGHSGSWKWEHGFGQTTPSDYTLYHMLATQNKELADKIVREFSCTVVGQTIVSVPATLSLSGVDKDAITELLNEEIAILTRIRNIIAT